MELVQRLKAWFVTRYFVISLYFSPICSWRRSCLSLRQCEQWRAPRTHAPGAWLKSKLCDSWITGIFDKSLRITETQVSYLWNKQKIRTSHGCCKTKSYAVILRNPSPRRPRASRGRLVEETIQQQKAIAGRPPTWDISQTVKGIQVPNTSHHLFKFLFFFYLLFLHPRLPQRILLSYSLKFLSTSSPQPHFSSLSFQPPIPPLSILLLYRWILPLFQ